DVGGAQRRSVTLVTDAGVLGNRRWLRSVTDASDARGLRSVTLGDGRRLRSVTLGVGRGLRSVTLGDGRGLRSLTLGDGR
ncbi:hypothetical protein CRG98_048928, partial [Punica granatum]